MLVGVGTDSRRIRILAAIFLVAQVTLGFVPAADAGDAEVAPLLVPTIADTLPLAGGGIYYEIFGEGYPLVFIHDGLAHSEIWDAQTMTFARDYRVVRYDRRGYGRSPQPEAPYSNVEDLAALLAALGINRAVLVASSSGGGLALDFALEHPDLVEAMVLSGPVVNGLGYSFHFMKRSYANFGPDQEATIELWSDDPYAVAPGNDAARERLRALLRSNPHNLDFGKNRLRRDPERAALGRLGEITAPTLLIVGDRDIPDVHAHVGAIEAGIPGARRVVVGHAGHLPYLEQPSLFNDQVREFLSLLTLAPESPRLVANPEPPWETFVNGFAKVDGTALYYEVMGAGEPVILLHGGAIDHRMWDPQFVGLAEHYRVIRYDIRGHGLSQSPFGVYCNFEDLRDLLEHLEIDRAHLVGLSLGCRVAADLAIAHPKMVASLVLCSPGLSGSRFDAPEEQEYLQKIGAAWGAGDFAQAAEEFVRAWCDGPHRTPQEVSPDVRAKIKGMALETVRPDRDLGRGIELEPPAIERLGEIQVPTLAVLGALDMPGIHEAIRTIEANVKDVRIITLSGAAHMVNLERTKKFDSAVRSFLDEQPGRQVGTQTPQTPQ